MGDFEVTESSKESQPLEQAAISVTLEIDLETLFHFVSPDPMVACDQVDDSREDFLERNLG